ncbi:acylneuraminate cytidylyltransferase family protein [Parvularcula sp. IMCC14364]|uniref:acylneuraminate cytidylyltransferase family protein n=1 Tax=Parvularcula sp. IMCC14364 TaxID=3067902 RepID=UPI002741F00E|nr:acylneuraminate cytidylyltransferase family protein [Parvularcula sp. IMCC14364]
MALIGLIPLRAGSKELPGKNTRSLTGRPLFQHSIDHARSAGIESLIVSTDIEELFDTDLGSDVIVARRPPELGADNTPMNHVLRHVLARDFPEPGTIVLLQATSPLRDPSDIRRAIDLHAAEDYDLVMSVTEANSSVMKWGRIEGQDFLPLSDPTYCFANRDDLPAVYRPNGAIYVFDADWFREVGTLSGGRIGAIQMPAERSHDIDTRADFEAVSALISSDKRRDA